MNSPNPEPDPADLRRRRVGTLLVLGLFVVGGLWLLGVVAAELAGWQAARAWPVVPAQVVDAGVVAVAADETNEAGYRVALRYRYVVGGQAYESDRLRREGTESFGTQAAAEEVLAAYLARVPFVAHVDPTDPATVVLSVGPPVYLLLFVGFYWAALLGFLVAYRRRQRPSE